MPPPDDGIWQKPPPAGPPAQPWSGYMDVADPAAGSTVVEVGDDGGVTVRTVGSAAPRKSGNFGENLAERPELASALAEIASDLMQGIEADIQSRQQFVENYTRGIDMLGLNIEDGNRGRGQKRKTSAVRDTTLLESVVKAQSQARGELLPAAGPAKVSTVAKAAEQEVDRAADFEADFNLALTKGMPEYVPDLDRGLFGFFYGGNMFRYGYVDPLKGRPCVSTVGVEDLIVSEEATDLDTATRWTIRIPAVSPGEVRRRQYRGQWREVELGTPMPANDAVQQKKSELAGMTATSMRPQDQPFTIYHTVTDLDLAMYGLEERGAPDLPLPYRVTIEKDSRQILRIERFWKDGDERFARKRRCVHYGMVPGLGFLAYGFLHLQGNQVATLTAIVRLLVDAMMFGTFPGGVKVKGVRTETNEIEPGPGEWVELGVPGGMDDIRKAIMALPYKDLSPVSIQLYELVQQACARVGAAAMLEVGEGRANVPVGTIMALLEEKSVVMGAVHKRLHEAMGQELTMLRELFAERPETLGQVLENPRRRWAAAEEFADLELVPASDPNIPSQVHRLMLATALATLLSMPVVAQRLDVDDALKRVLRMIGISDVDTLVVQPAPQADPGAGAAQATLAAKQMDIQSKSQENQRKAAAEVVKAQQQERDSQRQAAVDTAKIQGDLQIAGIRAQTEADRMAADERRAAAEREHDVGMAGVQQQQRTFGGQGL